MSQAELDEDVVGKLNALGSIEARTLEVRDELFELRTNVLDRCARIGRGAFSESDLVELRVVASLEDRVFSLESGIMRARGLLLASDGPGDAGRLVGAQEGVRNLDSALKAAERDLRELRATVFAAHSPPSDYGSSRAVARA